MPAIAWKENMDPIKLYSKKLLTEKIITIDELENINKEEKYNVEKAINFAETSPLPLADDAFTNVFIQ